MPCLVTVQTQTKTRRSHINSSELLVSRVRSLGGFHRHGQVCRLAMVTEPSISLKCLPKFATGTSSQRRWKQLVPHQARCTSAPKHWQKASSIQYPQASLKLLTAFPLSLSDVNFRPGLFRVETRLGRCQTKTDPFTRQRKNPVVRAG